MQSEKAPLVLKDLKYGVLTLFLHRPESRNAWAPDIEECLKSALLDADSDPDVKAVILTGAGKTFCPGVDPNALAKLMEKPSQSERSSENLTQRYSYFLGLRKPLIAAINGATAGVGLCIALYCDLRFISESAKITTAFTRRGLIAEHGIAWILPRLIGHMNAADLLLSGRVVTGREAHAIGLARALPADGFLEAVQLYTTEMAENCSPRSMCVVKRQLGAGLHQTLAEAVALSEAETQLAIRAPDLKEGVDHFVEKRPARFPPLL